MFIESPYCSYYVAIQSGFLVFIRVSGIRGFGFRDGLSPESVFGAVLGFDFGFRVRVHKDSTRSESAPLPSLAIMSRGKHWATDNKRVPMEKKKALFVSFGIDFNFFVRIASISIL
jgi:hypothetical protein